MGQTVMPLESTTLARIVEPMAMPTIAPEEMPVRQTPG